MRLFTRWHELNESVATLERRSAMTQGQISALVAIVHYVIKEMDADQRTAVAGVIKGGLGRRVDGNPEWLTEENKKAYNNALSATLMAVVEDLELNC